MERLSPLFSFKGRATRLTYWRVQLLASILGGLAVMLAMLLIPVLGQAGGVAMLLVAPALVASVATGVRRLHDRNRTGWWLAVYTFGPTLLYAWVETQRAGMDGVSLAMLLASLAALLLWVWSLVDLGFLRGTQGNNRFGTDPHAPSAEEVFA